MRFAVSTVALSHVSTFVTGARRWAALFEPLPVPAWFTAGWKVGYLTIVRLVQATLANLLLFDETPLYAHYIHVPRVWGLAASDDQNIAGSILLLEGMFVLLSAYAWALSPFFTESDVRQTLLEQGLERRVANRAARYGVRPPPPIDGDIER